MFCTQCGKSISSVFAFCASCGARIDIAQVASDEKESKVIASLPSSSDISWSMITANFLGMFLIAYVTQPIGSELKGLNAPIYLIIRVGVPVVFASIVSGIFYKFQKKKEQRFLVRNIVIFSWAFLALVILGEMGI